MKKRFALIGAAGYVAPRHLKAIKETGHELVAAYDPFDSVGILDSYFPEASFFTEFGRFDRFVDKQKREGLPIDYFSICSPNYLHDAHVRFALKNDAHAICEKPLVINPWNLKAIEESEKETGKRVFNILQLRLHERVKALKEKISTTNKDQTFRVDLQYITSRGKWYHYSWKGDEEKSGGIVMNIGIHLFDMLLWLFGPVREMKVDLLEKDIAKGQLIFDQANVNWLLSINKDYLPKEIQEKKLSTFRQLKIDDEVFEFTKGFNNLHTESYEQILAGKGFGLHEVKNGIELVHQLRNREIGA